MMKGTEGIAMGVMKAVMVPATHKIYGATNLAVHDRDGGKIVTTTRFNMN
jgi:hypothetical protein